MEFPSTSCPVWLFCVFVCVVYTRVHSFNFGILSLVTSQNKKRARSREIERNTFLELLHTDIYHKLAEQFPAILSLVSFLHRTHRIYFYYDCVTPPPNTHQQEITHKHKGITHTYTHMYVSVCSHLFSLYVACVFYFSLPHITRTHSYSVLSRVFHSHTLR